MDGGGASTGSGASLGLSLNAALVEVGQLFASRERARLATETELANKEIYTEQVYSPLDTLQSDTSRLDRKGMSPK